MDNIAHNHSAQSFTKLTNETINIIKLCLKKLSHSKEDNIINIYDEKYKPKLLLIGDNEPGKKSIIETLSLHSNDVLTNNNHECRAIVSNDQVVFNIPGELIQNEESISCWQNIFKIFKKNNIKNPFDGIILSLDIQKIIHSPKATKCKENLLLQNILHLAASILRRKIPIYIAIANMDVLVGFEEFFKDMPLEDLEDIWGLELPHEIQLDKIDDILAHSFKNMQSNLEKRLHWKLNSLASPKDISLAYEFPLQFSSTKQYITNFLKQVISKNILNNFFISGIFFTSNNQSNKKTDYFVQYTKRILSLNLMLDTKFVREKSLTFFVKKLLLKNIPNKTKKIKPAKKIIYKYTINNFFIVLSSFFFLIAAISSVYIIKYDYPKITKINNALFDYRIQLHKISGSSQKLPELLKLLAILTSIDQQYSNILSFKLFPPSMSNKNVLENNLDNLHAKTYQAILFPFMQEKLENELELAMKNSNISEIYYSLKAYLMLNTSNNYDSNYLIGRITYILGNDPFLETNNIIKLQKLAEQALHTSPALKLNQDLVYQAKKILIPISSVDLVYELFKSHTLKNTIENAGLDSEPLFVPNHLQAAEFVRYYANLIPETCKEFMLFYSQLVQPNYNSESLTKAVQDKYVKEYITYWKTYLASLLPNTKIKDTDSVDDVLHRLYTSIQYLDTAIRLIEKNTSPILNDSHAANLFNHFVANKLQTDNNLSTIADESFTKILNLIHNYYINLKQSHNQSEQIFREIRNTFNSQNSIFNSILTLDTSTIHTLNNWLYEFGKSLWKHHLLQTEQYIQRIWEKDIYPEFTQKLYGKYPFQKKTHMDATLEDFTSFFGPNGKIDNFFKKYIKPFYNTEQTNWSQIIKFNSKPKFIKSIPEVFIKSQIIQTMYFNDSKPSISLSLTPIKIEPFVKKVELVVNNKKITYKHNRQTSLSLEWPFESETINLTSETINHQRASAIFNSTWGLFKLMDKAAVSILNKNEYQLLFKLNSSKIAFSISFSKQIHPLIKGVVEEFKLPEKLIN